MGTLLGPDPERARSALPVPVSAPVSVDNDVDVARIARGVFSRKRQILISTLIFGALLATPLYLLRKDSWVSTCRVLVQPTRSAYVGTALEGHSLFQADMVTTVELVLVEPILERAARRLGMPEADLVEALEVKGQDRSKVIVVSGKASSPVRAAEIANRFTDEFVSYYHGDIANQVTSLQGSVALRVEQAKTRARDTQTALSDFVRSKDLADESELETVLERVLEAEATLGGLVARREAVKSQLERTMELLQKEEKFVRSHSSSSSSSKPASTLWDRLRQDAANAPSVAAPSAPEKGQPGWIKGTKPEKKLGSTSTLSPNPVHQSLYMAAIEYETESVALDSEIRRMEGELVKLRQRRDTLPSIRKEYQGLRVERDFALEELNSALSQLATVQTLVHRTNPVFQVLERAEPPEKPERSKRLLFGALAGFVALAGSVGWAFLSEVRDTRVREENEIERLGVPVLARIPSGREGAAKHREAYERVAQEVRRRARASGSFCLLVTSTKPREGKSQVVHGVTSTLVDWGEQVLRIDANFREPTGAQPQLERYLSGELEQPTLLKYRSGLYAISCGGHRQDAPALLASSWMDRLIERARASFPVTIVDGAALEPGVDAELLAERVDAVLLVVRTRDVELGSVRRAVERLRKLGTSILGVVMVDSSGADTKRPSERRPAA